MKDLGWSTGAELELQRAIDIDPKYGEAHFNLTLVYLDRKPPALELARRQYKKARDLGAPPDGLVEEMLREKKEKGEVKGGNKAKTKVKKSDKSKS